MNTRVEPALQESFNGDRNDMSCVAELTHQDQHGVLGTHCPWQMTVSHLPGYWYRIHPWLSVEILHELQAGRKKKSLQT